MFNPRYRITDHCLSLISKIVDLTARVNHANVTFPLMTRMQKEAISKSAHASTSIEGNTLSLAQVSALSDNRPVDADSLQKKEVANYLAALRWIIKNASSPITEKQLSRLHALIVRGLVAGTKAGRYKARQNYVVDANKRVVFTPPAPAQCPGLMRDLVKWVNRASNTHPVIVSAVFHHQCVSIHPFADGNGRLSRAAAQWILYQRKFDPRHILSLDAFYANDRQRYYAKIQQARDLDHDLTHWIEYVAEGVANAVEQAYARISKLALSSKQRIMITPKQEQLVELLNMEGILNSPDIGRLLKINRARVNQLVSPLVKAGIIRKEGSARATRYSLKK